MRPEITKSINIRLNQELIELIIPGIVVHVSGQLPVCK